MKAKKLEKRKSKKLRSKPIPRPRPKKLKLKYGSIKNYAKYLGNTVWEGIKTPFIGTLRKFKGKSFLNNRLYYINYIFNIRQNIEKLEKTITKNIKSLSDDDNKILKKIYENIQKLCIIYGKSGNSNRCVDLLKKYDINVIIISHNNIFININNVKIKIDNNSSEIIDDIKYDMIVLYNNFFEKEENLDKEINKNKLISLLEKLKILFLNDENFINSLNEWLKNINLTINLKNNLKNNFIKITNYNTEILFLYNKNYLRYNKNNNIIYESNNFFNILNGLLTNLMNYYNFSENDHIDEYKNYIIEDFKYINYYLKLNNLKKYKIHDVNISYNNSTGIVNISDVKGSYSFNEKNNEFYKEADYKNDEDNENDFEEKSENP